MRTAPAQAAVSATPPPALAYTGERCILGVTPRRSASEHLERYRWATRFARARAVLDVACGSGYGTRMLADAGAYHVHGVDAAPEAVAYARHHFAHPRATYHEADAARLPLAAGSVDLIVCYETLEHVQDAPAFLRELRRVLHPGGIALISTPNRLVYSGGAAKPTNPYHTREYDPHEFADLLRGHFKSFRLQAQSPERRIPDGIRYARHRAATHLAQKGSLGRRVARLVAPSAREDDNATTLTAEALLRLQHGHAVHAYDPHAWNRPKILIAACTGPREVPP